MKIPMTVQEAEALLQRLRDDRAEMQDSTRKLVQRCNLLACNHVWADEAGREEIEKEITGLHARLNMIPMKSAYYGAANEIAQLYLVHVKAKAEEQKIVDLEQRLESYEERLEKEKDSIEHGMLSSQVSRLQSEIETKKKALARENGELRKFDIENVDLEDPCSWNGHLQINTNTSESQTRAIRADLSRVSLPASAEKSLSI